MQGGRQGGGAGTRANRRRGSRLRPCSHHCPCPQRTQHLLRHCRDHVLSRAWPPGHQGHWGDPEFPSSLGSLYIQRHKGPGGTCEPSPGHLLGTHSPGVHTWPVPGPHLGARPTRVPATGKEAFGATLCIKTPASAGETPDPSRWKGSTAVLVCRRQSRSQMGVSCACRHRQPCPSEDEASQGAPAPCSSKAASAAQTPTGQTPTHRQA